MRYSVFSPVSLSFLPKLNKSYMTFWNFLSNKHKKPCCPTAKDFQNQYKRPAEIVPVTRKPALFLKECG